VIKRNINTLFVLGAFLCFSNLFAQNKAPVRFGISLNTGVSKSNIQNSSNKLSYGVGVNSTFNILEKMGGTLELEYNIKKEKFKDLKNYYFDSNGELSTQQFSIIKNYGLLDLKLAINYKLYSIKKFEILGIGGIGFNTLFWYGTKLESDSFETITNGKTQLKTTNPLTRPTFAIGPGIRFPFDKDKVMVIKTEYVADCRFKSATNTYPNFITLRTKFQIIF
jgi:hypothetical protein